MSYRWPMESRPSKAMSKAWSAGFQRMVQRLRPARVRAQLTGEQQDLLLALGIEEEQELAAEAAVAAERAARPVKGRADRFAQHLQALRAFARREGQVRVPRAHKEPLKTVEGSGEPVLLGLGAWLSNQRNRRAKLSAEQFVALGRAGVEWAAELAPVRRESEEAVQA